MATKLEIVKEIFAMTENSEAQKKLRNNYHYHKFLGLDLNCQQLKYAMAVNFNKFSKIEYIFLLQEIKKALA